MWLRCKRYCDFTVQLRFKKLGSIINNYSFVSIYLLIAFSIYSLKYVCKIKLIQLIYKD